jgi:hypothetical protein
LTAKAEHLGDLRHSHEVVRHKSILTQSSHVCKDEVMN